MLLIEEEKIANGWDEYLEDIYRGNNDREIEQFTREDQLGPHNMESEFTKAIQEMKFNKATGLDEISVELWKYAGEETIHVLFKMVEEIDREGRLPKDFTCNKIICTPKKKELKQNVVIIEQ